MAMEPDVRRQIERLTAYMEINNLMGRYSFWLAAGMKSSCRSLFSDRADACVEMAWGNYVGDDIEKIYPAKCADGENPPGHLHMHALTTPVIEVAGDGETARGVWLSPGHMTFPSQDGELSAYWSWIRYSADFVLENDAWKIWHIRANGIFTTRYETPWTNNADAPEPMPELPYELQPTEPRRTPDWTYTPDGVFENDPPPPMPYANWDIV